MTKAVERWECDVREYEQRFGKTLDEDVKIGVILALAPSQVQNHCHLNSQILKSKARMRPLVMLYPWISRCWAKATRRAKGKAGKGEYNKDEKVNDKDGKGKGKANDKTSNHFPGYCLVCKAWRHAMMDCWWNESAKSGKDTASLETTITPAANTATEPPITGMLPQSDEGEAVPANPWLYSVSKRKPSREEFRRRYVNRAWLAALERNPEDLVWNSGQPLEFFLTTTGGTTMGRCQRGE